MIGRLGELKRFRFLCGSGGRFVVSFVDVVTVICVCWNICFEV
jgi:hypothetical protein